MQPDLKQAPALAIFKIITDYWNSQCTYAAAKLGVADVLNDGPKPVEQIAKATGSHPPSLYRLMRALASSGLFTETQPRTFANTPVSEFLRSDIPASMRWLAIAELGQDHYRGWGNLLHAVRTGEKAFDEIAGENIWEYYQKNKEDGENFMKAMTGLSEGFNMAVVPSYDWSQFKTIVDVGGGNGSLLAHILNTNKTAKGILFDEPYVTTHADGILKSRGVADRVQVAGGDFFKSVPAGGDAYIMKVVIHDWDDEKCNIILKNIATVLTPKSKLLVIEGVIAGMNEPQIGKLLDINMLVMTGGMERTEEEYRNLFASAELKLVKVYPTPSPLNILEVIKN